MGKAVQSLNLAPDQRLANMKSRIRKLNKEDGLMEVIERTEEKERGSRQSGRCGGDVSGRCDRPAYWTSNSGKRDVDRPDTIVSSRLFLLLFCYFVVLSSCSSSVPYRSPQSSNGIGQ